MATQTPQQPQVPQAPKVDFTVFRNQQLPPADKPGEVIVGLKVSQVEYAVLKDMVQTPPDGPACQIQNPSVGLMIKLDTFQ